mmetsp:Transcript_74506/g.155315  ORF Transcript_74506/g.155315 Transcript_74506/m.155315 type:complete len:320 (+) Transcript_74506:251-1210(+)
MRGNFAHAGFGNPMQDFEKGQAYGSLPATPGPKSAFANRRHRSNPVSVASCIFVPVMVFAVVFSINGFSMHYNNASTCTTLSFCMLGFVLLLGWSAAVRFLKMGEGQDPKWTTFIFITALAAWIFGYVFGNKNFRVNIRPYMDIMSLNLYPDIDPAEYRSQQVMDAGRIYFSEGTKLDLDHSMGFKNYDTYCVSPIVSKDNKTAGDSYDFWAVGMNCCSGHIPDFHCGDFDNPKARAGLRLMNDGQRAYFRLAVQQAEAAYKIRAPHPVFVYWMEDPMSEVNAYQDAGYKYWLIGVSVVAGVQILLVVLAAVAFSLLGI